MTTYETEMREALMNPLGNVRVYDPKFGEVSGLSVHEIFSHGYALGREDEARSIFLEISGKHRQANNVKSVRSRMWHGQIATI